MHYVEGFQIFLVPVDDKIRNYQLIIILLTPIAPNNDFLIASAATRKQQV